MSADGVLAVVAIATLAIIANVLGGELNVPWDGIVPFVVIGGVLLAASAAVDLAFRRQIEIARSLRLWAPFAIVYLCYRALRGALPVLVDGGVEHALVRADIALLGSSPAWSLEAIHAPWLTELLSYAY